MPPLEEGRLESNEAVAARPVQSWDVFDSSAANGRAWRNNDTTAAATKSCEFLNGFELTFSNTAGRELPDNATADERRAFMANADNRLPADIKSMWDKNKRVLAIGDQHLTTDIKQYSIDNMKAFRCAGATEIGMELFQTKDQGVLDRYRDIRLDPGRAHELNDARAAVEALLRQSQESRYVKPSGEQGEPPQPGLDPDAAVGKTMEIIDAAIDNGIRPLAIEPSIPNAFGEKDGYDLLQEGMQNLPVDARGNFDNFTNPRATEQERAAARAQLEKHLAGYERASQFLDMLGTARDARFDFTGLKLSDKSGAGDRDFTNAIHNFRNLYWADTAGRHLHENPSSRLIMFAGTQHFNYNMREALGTPSANERLAERGFSTTVLQFAGGDFAKNHVFDFEMNNVRQARARQGAAPDATPPDAAMSAALRYTRPAQDAGVADREFALRLKSTSQREGDYVVHLRQR